MAKIDQLFGLGKKNPAQPDEVVISLYTVDRYAEGKSVGPAGNLFIRQVGDELKCRVDVRPDSAIVSFEANGRQVISIHIPDGRHMGDVYIEGGLLKHFGKQPPEVNRIAKQNGKGQKKAFRGARERDE